MTDRDDLLVSMAAAVQESQALSSALTRTVTELLQELSATRKELKRVTTGVLNMKALRASCEESFDGVYRVHVREGDWDRLQSQCRDVAQALLTQEDIREI